MKLIAVCFLCLFCKMSFAGDCFELAGKDYHIDPDILRAIAWQESRFTVSAIGKNTNNSVDVGLMQINSQHTTELGKYGITQYHLSNDACMNIYTGAYYLAISFKKWGVNWNAVGAYNAGFAKTQKQAIKRYQYAAKIHAIYLAIKNSKSKSVKTVMK